MLMFKLFLKSPWLVVILSVTSVVNIFIVECSLEPEAVAPG